MSYQVICTFDLKAASFDDYKNAYSDLASIGLKKIHAGTSGQVVIPTTTTLGTFTGLSVKNVMEDIRGKVSELFKVRRFTSEIFVAVGIDGTWGATTT